MHSTLPPRMSQFEGPALVVIAPDTTSNPTDNEHSQETLKRVDSHPYSLTRWVCRRWKLQSANLPQGSAKLDPLHLQFDIPGRASNHPLREFKHFACRNRGSSDSFVATKISERGMPDLGRVSTTRAPGAEQKNYVIISPSLSYVLHTQLRLSVYIGARSWPIHLAATGSS